MGITSYIIDKVFDGVLDALKTTAKDKFEDALYSQSGSVGTIEYCLKTQFGIQLEALPAQYRSKLIHIWFAESNRNSYTQNRHEAKEIATIRVSEVTAFLALGPSGFAERIGNEGLSRALALREAIIKGSTNHSLYKAPNLEYLLFSIATQCGMLDAGYIVEMEESFREAIATEKDSTADREKLRYSGGKTVD